MQNEEESQELWKLLLQRDFGFDISIQQQQQQQSKNNTTAGNKKDNNLEWTTTTTLAIAPRSDTVHSIFGVDPIHGGAVQQVANPFECWKHWIKCSQRFYSLQGAQQQKQEKKPFRMNGPFFLRAAILWGKIFTWLETAGELGIRIKRQFSQGVHYTEWDKSFCDRPGVKACQAVYAFCGATVFSRREFFDGLLGGYSAYDFISCTHLTPPQTVYNGRFVIACDQDPETKGFCVDSITGIIHLFSYSTDETWPAINVEKTSNGLGIDAVLCWFEEYAERLISGRIGEGRMVPNHPTSILLYPRFPLNEPLATTEGVQAISRAVTRGIEVIASAVYVPCLVRMGWGFIYNIRIRLLTPQDCGYVSASDRGFEVCQLRTRHWQIRNFETGHVERVDGDGVIGKYPILREGGYMEGLNSYEGTFSYTSCTGPMQGSFSGHMGFVPGTLTQLTSTGFIPPTGPSFDVELRPFALDNKPDFLF